MLSSHDETRLVTRYGRKTTSSAHFADGQGEAIDVELGTRRSRAAALLMLALPGCAYIYQGEELGLPNVEDLPDEVLQDPVFKRSNGEMRGRDGCRVPLPWEGDGAALRVLPPTGCTPWLPQPETWAELTVEAQLRRSRVDAQPVPAGPPAAARDRRAADRRLRLAGHRPRACSTSTADAELALRGQPVRCSRTRSARRRSWSRAAPVEDGMLPHDSAAWLRSDSGSAAAT